ncbi:rod shape-determining protein MreC [Lacticaseibacillus chiayiensis]|uniref:Cell shape-determining protein MreC n=1 Tax=Lacticaseibacillus chiayiensis TaxID=2100821 RepID=A0A4Q1UER8_9LACO|nr:rod shape-determining protein MreC [Lacticaseibacillus chiayiensis]QVI35731.1 rod shape-determining protein MreC [Lacticaseibacillus chiayiensis]RXT30223.1 rod shape-determining protein MreC [Lacticaseibacillus chiayiensis]UYN57565.1 rod shape-determining protein MreC [Lacticaseibacillus chiayiensis]
MQKFFSNKKLIALMIALLVSLGLVAGSTYVSNNRNTPPFIQRIANDVVGIGGRIVALPGDLARNGLDDVHNLMNTFQENQHLKQQLDSLAQTKVQVQTLKRENQQLKQQLKLNGTLTDYSQISAAVILRAPSDWRNIVVINQGSAAGVKKGMPVMAGSGLVGRIVEVNRTNSKVEMLSTANKSSDRVAAAVETSEDKEVNGIITGYDEKSGDLVLGELSSEHTIKKGDKVVTSGLGGMTPKGLLIGEVASVKKDDYGLANNVYLSPAANLNDVTVVTVISRTIKGD